MPEEPGLLSARQVARLLHVRLATVLEWLAGGHLPAMRRGTRWYVDGEQLREFVQQRARAEAEARKDATRGC